MTVFPNVWDGELVLNWTWNFYKFKITFVDIEV